MDSKTIVNELVTNLCNAQTILDERYNGHDKLIELAVIDEAAHDMLTMYNKLNEDIDTLTAIYKLPRRVDRAVKTCKNCHYSECNDNGKCVYCHFEGPTYWDDTNNCDSWKLREYANGDK